MTSPLRRLPEALSQTTALEKVAEPLAKLAEALGPGTAKDALSGTWLGHPLHPVLTDVPVGAWTCSMVLDLVGGESAAGASRTLVGVGVLAAVPTAVSGWSDWADTDGEDRRIGIAHAVGNVAAATLYALSWVARRRGHRGRGILLGLLGGGVASATAYLGGHLVYGRGIGVDWTAFDRVPKRWTPVIDVDALHDGEPATVEVRGTEILLVRRGGEVLALANRCSHRGGPLAKGELDAQTVTCPWHGSRFLLATGDVVRGPATSPQPRYETRITEGKVELRRVSA
jgi:nitrite reductase/ring-hydroxylating ferredoxin subunit/uncharacterized membrane protein